MTTSEAINEIAAALAKAQATMKNAALNKVNPHFRSKYADLAGIRDAVIPALAGQGIAVVQTLDFDETGAMVLTRLVHSSGQWIESACRVPAGKNMQEMGSAITYARRYSISAICGIAADEDDDANAASAPPRAVVHDEMPKGYEDWLIDLETVAEGGVDALRAAWVKSHASLRNYLTGTNSAKWEALKEKAAKREPVRA